MYNTPIRSEMYDDKGLSEKISPVDFSELF